MNKISHSPISKFSFRPALTALGVAACVTVSGWSAKAQTQNYWLGGTGDFNIPGNWSLGVVPTNGYAANNDTGSNNVVQINNGDPGWTLNGIRVGISSSGSFAQTGSTVNLSYTQGGWLRMGVTAAGSVGYYTINSNAVLNTPNGITVGEAGSGILNIYGGTVNVGTAATTNFVVNSAGVSGIVNQTNGTVVCSNQLWISQGTGSSSPFTGTGAYNLSGGTLNVNNFIVIGRSGGNGTLTMTGGTIHMQNTADFFSVGSSAGTAAVSSGIVKQSGGVIDCGGQFLVPAQAAGTTGTYNLSGSGVLNLTNWLAIGRTGGAGYLNLMGGAITFWSGNGGNLDIGATGPGTLTQTGGAITNTVLGTWIGEQSSGNGTWMMNGGIAVVGQITIGVTAGATGTLNLNGGLLNATGITAGNSGASSTLTFNGGVLQAKAGNPSFVSGLSAAYVSSGGAVIDSQSYNVTIPQNLYDNGGGSLVKAGSGALTLTGANSYSGPTMVNAGALATTTASTGAGSYTVADGASLSVKSTFANGQLFTSGLTLGNSTGATLSIDLNTFGNPYAAPIDVFGTLAINGAVTLNVLAEAPLGVGQFPLIAYGSEAGSGSFTLGTLPVGAAGYLSNNTANLSVDLVITSAGAPSWNGTVAGGVWDVGVTTNWIDAITSAVESYHDGEPVFFGDNAAGTTNVYLVATVNPGSMTINNNSLLYTLTGPGQINGTTGLLKEGANTFAMLNTPGNGYTGATVLEGGILAVTNLANGGSPSAIGASSASPTNLALAGGTLSYSGPAVSVNRGYSAQDTLGAVDIYTGNDLALGGTVSASSGSGFTKGGPAQLIYATVGTNTLSDTLGYTVAQGAVVFSGSGAGQIDNVAGNLNVGNAGSSNATVVLTNNTTLNLVTGGIAAVGNGGGVASSGAMTQAGGVFNAGSGQIWLGQNTGGVGTYNLNGGKLIVNNWLAVGRDNGTGTLNMSGNAVLTMAGGNYAFDIGTSGGIGGATGSGLFTQTGGILTNNAPTWLGEGAAGEPAQGVWNISGGSAWLFGSAVGSYPAASLYVGQSGIGTNAVDISGAGAITCADYVSIGHLSGVTGLMNIGSASQPGGTMAMSGTADFNVGDSGNGVLTMAAGGQLVVPGTLYLTRSATASGVVNLNGGVITAAHVNNGYGFANNLTNNAQTFNFNGGTLKAYISTTVFVQPYVNTVVQSGGAVIDDGGYNVSVDSALVDGGGGGGLTKLGGGSLYLNGVNTYTGTTVVSNGTLGCSSVIAGPVVVEPGATLAGDTGSIATFSISNTLTLSPGSATRMSVSASANDEIAGLTGVSYGGTLVVTNTSGAPLAIGQTYQLFSSSAPGSGNFSSVTVVPAGNATFNPATGVLTISSPTPVTMQPPVISGGNLIISGSGGAAGGGYTLLTTTNLAAPLSAWVTNAAGTLSGSGSFTNSIPIDPGAPAEFFLLRQP